jgi:hypothetical protein
MIVIQVKYCHNHDLHVDIKNIFIFITQRRYIIVLYIFKN